MSDPSRAQCAVFLHHSAKHKTVVRALVDCLPADGPRMPFDESAIKPGDRIRAKIEDGLERSRFARAVHVRECLRLGLSAP